VSLLGIDVGTTGSKVVIFSRSGEIIAEEYAEHPLIAPKKGWVELDPNLIFFNIKNILKKAVQKTKNDKVKALARLCWQAYQLENIKISRKRQNAP